MGEGSADKPEDLGLSPRSHTVEGDNRFPQTVL